jgi:hypothetical protein
VYLSVVSELRKGARIAQGDVDESMVGESGHHGDGGRLLTTALGASGNEETDVFASELASSPEPTCSVPESLR